MKAHGQISKSVVTSNMTMRPSLLKLDIKQHYLGVKKNTTGSLSNLKLDLCTTLEFSM